MTTQYSYIKDFNKETIGDVLFRARVTTTRGKGNMCFLLLRQSYYSVQGIIAKSDTVSKDVVKMCQGIPSESIVDIRGDLVPSKVRVDSATQNDVEVQIKNVDIISKSDVLPLQLADAGRAQHLLDEQRVEYNKITEMIDNTIGESERERLIKERDSVIQFVDVDQCTRLDNRIIDLRTPANQAIFRLQSHLCRLFREFLLNEDFTEIHTPKTIGTASEGGANVFELKYFDKPAYLAQSPQLYKQMMIMADFDRVFEIGPVFRAENSNSHRHMTEFTGMDMEMTFENDYHNVLKIIGRMFNHIFKGLYEQTELLYAFGGQFNHKPFEFLDEPLILEFKDGIKMLQDNGIEIGEFDDMNFAQERRLGQLVKDKYKTDFYILDKFPLTIRPFYTMPDPDRPGYSNSYDMFMRGEEIVSGAQRIHDPEILTQRAKDCGVDLTKIKPYIDAFRYGSKPHAGCGVGMERVLMLFLGLDNIRKTSAFPRDPNRLTP